MEEMQFVALVLALAAAAGWVAVRLRRRAAADEASAGPREERPPLAPGLQPSAQTLCEEASATLEAHVALLAREGETLHLVGCAPRTPTFQLLDTVAAQWALSHCIPAGRGTGVMTASDWRFEPVISEGMVRGLLAVAGRGAREPVAPEQDWVLENALRGAGRALARIDRQEIGTAPVGLVLS